MLLEVLDLLLEDLHLTILSMTTYSPIYKITEDHHVVAKDPTVISNKNYKRCKRVPAAADDIVHKTTKGLQ